MMIRRITTLAATAALLAFAGPGHAATGLTEVTVGSAKVLADAKGMTLYTFDKDEGGKSACYDDCAVNWPPLIAAADAVADAEYGLTDRTDGTKQWTHKQMPLYLWVKDAKPGDMTGDGVNGVWHTAKAD